MVADLDPTCVSWTAGCGGLSAPAAPQVGGAAALPHRVFAEISGLASLEGLARRLLYAFTNATQRVAARSPVMSSIRTFLRSAAVALSLAVVAAPTAALAEEGKRPAPADQKGGEHGKGKGKRHEDKQGKRKGRGQGEVPQFPVEAKKFQEMVEARIAKAREHMESALGKHNVPEPIRAMIRKDFEAGAAEIREAAKKAAADGSVTKEEAKEVRELSRDLKREAREKYLPGGKTKRGGKES